MNRRKTIAAQMRSAKDDIERMSVAFYGTKDLPPKFKEIERFLAYGQRRLRRKMPRAADEQIARALSDWMVPAVLNLDAEFFRAVVQCIQFFKRHKETTPYEVFYKDRQRVVLMLLKSPGFGYVGRRYTLKEIRARSGKTFVGTDDRQLRRMVKEIGM